MKQISFEESKHIQIKTLEIIDKCCRENGIKYSLTWGTLIGAIRHKGFIPWDDDIDLMMKRDDYERFLRCFNEPYYKLHYFKKNKFWHQFLTKVTDERTVVVFNYRKTGTFGLWVSIFPIDNVPDDGIEEWKKRLHKKATLFRLRTAIWRNDTSLSRNILKMFFRGLLSPFSSYRLGMSVEALLKENNNKQTKQVCLWDGGRGVTAFCYFPSELFDYYIETEFEGKNYMVIREYDKFLRDYYGDYMQLPPVESRVPLHDFKAYYR